MSCDLKFRDLILRHRGKRVLIMGGAPCLPVDLKAVKSDIVISTNGHGSDIRKPDYFVAMDDRHCDHDYEMVPHLRKISDAPIIGPWPENDIYLPEWPGAPRKTFSGLVATWLAWVMGGHPVILAGFTSYAESLETARPGDYRRHVGRAVMFEDYIRGNIRVVGRSIGNSWPIYDPKERFGRYKEHSSIRALLGIDEEIRVEIRKPVTVDGREQSIGAEITVRRQDPHIRRLLKHRVAVEI